MTNELELIEFTATDRCDQCSAQAHHLARKPGFSDLLFCKHHVRKHKEKLLDTDWTIISDTEGVETVGSPAVPVKN